MGPTCYPIVAETPSGPLRYKTIAIGRFAYNIVSLIQNTITPRMLSSTCTFVHLSRYYIRVKLTFLLQRGTGVLYVSLLSNPWVGNAAVTCRIIAVSMHHVTHTLQTPSNICLHIVQKSGLFYAGTNLCCIIWCFFRLPETKDRPFGEIDLLFENRVPARKFKTTKVDRKLLLARQCIEGYSNFRLCAEFAHGAIFEAKAEEAGNGTSAHLDKV